MCSPFEVSTRSRCVNYLPTLLSLFLKNKNCMSARCSSSEIITHRCVLQSSSWGCYWYDATVSSVQVRKNVSYANNNSNRRSKFLVRIFCIPCVLLIWIDFTGLPYAVWNIVLWKIAVKNARTYWLGQYIREQR